MLTISIDQVQSLLMQALTDLPPGHEISIVCDGKPMAFVKKLQDSVSSRKAGSAKGKIRMAPDFDAPLDDFKEYME